MLRVFLVAFLLMNVTCCTRVPPACPKRPPFTGETYQDLGRYCGSLERQYDACSGK